jgi:hypothetical protein
MWSRESLMLAAVDGVISAAAFAAADCLVYDLRGDEQNCPGGSPVVGVNHSLSVPVHLVTYNIRM